MVFLIGKVSFSLRMEGQRLLPDHDLELIFGGFEVVPPPIKDLLTKRLFLGVMESIKIRMC